MGTKLALIPSHTVSELPQKRSKPISLLGATTDLSAGLELGRVVLPVVGGSGWFTPQAGAVRIGILDPGKMEPEDGLRY